MSNEIITNLRK